MTDSKSPMVLTT